MIGGLLMFLGSAGYLGYKAFSSNTARMEVEAHTRRLGLNVKRQLELERWVIGDSQYTRDKFLATLKAVEPNKMDMPSFCLGLKTRLLEEFGKFDEYSRLVKTIRSFSDMITINDQEYAVWLIAQHEGWTYNKHLFCTLPNFCSGHDASKDTYVKSRARKL